MAASYAAGLAVTFGPVARAGPSSPWELSRTVAGKGTRMGDAMQMHTATALVDAKVIDPSAGIDALIGALRSRGHRVLGPALVDGVIVVRELLAGADVPTGVRVEQAPGRWRAERSDDGTRFSWTPGADSWKGAVLPQRSEVLRVRRRDGSWVTTLTTPPARPLALFGARACELRALDILDRVLIDHDHPDPRYAARRDGTFVVAVTCAVPAPTCWCTSIGGSPVAVGGFDLRLTELADPDGHRIVVDAGSDHGRAVLAEIPGTAVTELDRVAVDAVGRDSVRSIEQRFEGLGDAAAPIDGTDLPSVLGAIDHHPHWDEVAERCLSCGNCTAVCPTCFCSTFADETGVDPDETVRLQEWVSCFQLDHSNLGGRPVRATTAARYRQWFTHKLVTWQEQMDSLGCVGCGRCTTWCPAGIDLPAEARRIAAQDGGS